MQQTQQLLTNHLQLQQKTALLLLLLPHLRLHALSVQPLPCLLAAHLLLLLLLPAWLLV
jgi:hypothetical protein